jgi:AcrR family transcriptional regulator
VLIDTEISRRLNVEVNQFMCRPSQKVAAMAAMGRPRAFDREAALDAAMRVFWRKGFSAASMNDLCVAMGIRSPSLYAAFGDKEALFLEAIGHYVRTVGPPVWGKLAEAATARDAVEALLAASVETLPGSVSTPAGCMALLGGVGDEWPAPITAVVRSIRLEMLDSLRRRLSAGAAEGEITRSDIERLSRYYLGVVQGMAIQARDGAKAAELRGVAETAMAAWPGAGTPHR